jgi:hypothetical protein
MVAYAANATSVALLSTDPYRPGSSAPAVRLDPDMALLSRPCPSAHPTEWRYFDRGGYLQCRLCHRAATNKATRAYHARRRARTC